MALINIIIEKVVLSYDDSKQMEILKRIEEKINAAMDDPDGSKKADIMEKLNAAIKDINTTV